MSKQTTETFQLTWSWPFVFVFGSVLFVIALFLGPFLVFFLIQFLLLILVIVLVSKFTITDEGIRLYFINMLRWEDVVSAEAKSVFGLPYLFIRRKKGFGWWLPLYFKGGRSIETALLEWAPSGNPLGEFGKS